MATKAGSRPPDLDDLDNYLLAEDLEDDVFASPKGDRSEPNKRKEPGDGLGLDEEVSVAKKARAPQVKLDSERLLSQKGIPALRRRARDLKLKGKGHEWGDASRLLSFYQEWLDDLFPRGKFLDALAMVEKAGHNEKLRKSRGDWINEGRPKTNVVDEGGDVDDAARTEQQGGDSAPQQADRIAPIFEKAASGRAKTPDVEDLFGDGDDIYNATPLGRRRNGAATDTGEPDDDELDALIAETEASGPTPSTRPSGGLVRSIFGDGKPKPAPAQPEDDDDDDLDALIAQAEAEQGSRQKPSTAAAKITEESGMTEESAGDEMDDLDALMAEAKAQPAPSNPAGVNASSASKAMASDLSNEEEAMAEMDGLW